MPKKRAPATFPKSRYDYKHFSQLSGRFGTLPKRGAYSVQFKPLMTRKETWQAIFLVLLTLGFEVAFLVWLFLPSHISFANLDGVTKSGVVAIIIFIAIIESLRIFNTFSLCLSALLARDPIPVRPERGKRLAFTTTIVPGKEPFELAEKTLVAAQNIRYDGPYDVWLLDEGNIPEIKAACKKMGVKHFSRKGIAKYNQLTGSFTTKTKHGNHNAWLDQHGDKYDYVISVDTDHVPHPNFAERFLGYFRDKDVAYVVGPQVYGNYNNFVTKMAESQAYLFQASIQRGGNAYRSPMFVGTNHAYRVSTWKQIGGFQDSITEDMYTGMAVHGSRNPATNNFWKSVYSPDVIAVGEGPSSWTDFFSQQLRWARGANELLLTKFFGLLRKMPFKTRAYYSLIGMYYPSVAISWIFSIFAGVTYIVLGQTGLSVTGDIWMALYADVTIASILLYAWLRRFNVSPHEPRPSIGFAGMFAGIAAAPIYVTALASTFLRSAPKFVVTAKGDSSSPDGVKTFRKHFLWAFVIVESLVVSAVTGNAYPVVIIWSLLILFMCLSPLLFWSVTDWRLIRARARRTTKRALGVVTFKKLAESKEQV